MSIALSEAVLDLELAALRALSRQYPTADSALAEVARLSAELTLPKPTIHVLSDIHGEHAKLRHVINNASGALRPLVQSMFEKSRTNEELQEFLTLVFYPVQALEHFLTSKLEPADRLEFVRRSLRDLFALAKRLAASRTLEQAIGVFPPEYRDLIRDLLHGPGNDGDQDYFEAAVQALARFDQVNELIHLMVRVVRNLTIDEIVIAGDCWDRGPRGDLVMDYLSRQPNVTFVWGNHDVSWLGACLGCEALIANVLRISLRYRRLSQLEEGYGITMQPLEHLVRQAYSDDAASCFVPKGTGLRPTELMARMQKATAVLQFKLEGQLIARNPWMNLDHRRLLHHINHVDGTIEIDGRILKLKDHHFPTIDPSDPYALSQGERECVDRIRQSFLASSKLWSHMQFLVGRGSMHLKRDHHLILHGCVPVDEQGEVLSLEVNGQCLGGKALYDALEKVVVESLRKPTEKHLDMLWYLWCGPRSPLFGKDKIATLENDLVDDHDAKTEVKNPFFHLIHEQAFCRKVLAEFGVDTSTDQGLIVNGHVPVKIEKGESPLKRSGMAITIDGAFSQAYGDHGYTLILEPEHTKLAKHHHFESIEAAVRDGVDIIPEITKIRHWTEPRKVSHTERGEEIRAQIALLERLVNAYRENRLRQGQRTA